MNKKLDIALKLLNAIEDLELSPEEVEVITEKWLSAHPSVSAQVGDKISVLSGVKNIAEEVDKLLHLLAPDTEIQPIKQPEATEESPLEAEDLLIVEEPSPAPESEPVAESEPTPEQQPQSEPVPELEPATEVKPPKGYSKNGKRLGRTPRKKLPPTAVKEKTALPKDEPVPEVEAKPVPEPPAEEILPVAAAPTAEPAPEPVKEESAKTEPKEPTKEEIAALQYGKTYELDAIYELNGFYVRTSRLMDGMAHPIGVVVPYTEKDSPGELLIRYCDEHAVIPIRQAAQYAKYKLVPYYGRRWRLKEGRDDARIKNSGLFPVLNTMLKKMGGDELKGNYFDGKSTYIGDKYDDNRKIRYVCDIFTPSNDET